MSVEKWIGGTTGSGLTYFSAFTASVLNSLASNNAILSDVSIDNSSNLDMFFSVSLILGSAAFTGGFVGVYLYPINSDNSTYGDGRFGTAAAGPPPGQYQIATIPIVGATQAQEGTTLPGLLLPPTKSKLVLWNNGGIAWAGSGANTCKIITYNRQIV
jgi:hypothetical protein